MSTTICSVALLAITASPLLAHDSSPTLIENDVLSVLVSPDGAELQSVKSKKTGREFLWQGDPKFWAGRAPLMFPVNVRFKGDRYTYKEQSYVIPKMGLAIYRPFKKVPSATKFATESTSKPVAKNEAVFELTANRDTLRQFPFQFRLQVTYRLDGNKLINEFLVENQGDETMPFALGGHPGFRFPITDKAKRADFEYWFSKTLTTTRREISGSLIQPKVVPFLKAESTLSFGDNRVGPGGLLLKKSPARVIGLARKGEQPFITIDLGDFPNANLWSPPGFPYACIEPMIAHHDFQEGSEALEEKDYLVRLDPKESKTFRFTITVYPDRVSE